jgi:hypothetical protein
MLVVAMQDEELRARNVIKEATKIENFFFIISSFLINNIISINLKK